ncbi:MAG: pyridoxal-dependent decarboxylase, partial [Oscillospiraceae bacterium]|nr:pyridoxal-dependent decarboxylase [Oscillospiraceae bacterium]
LKGIHLHRTSTTRSIEVYEAICRYADKVIRDNRLDLSYVDIGGGFCEKMPGKPEYHDYADAIRNSMDCENVTVIFEPGYALLQEPIDYLMRIIDRKTVGDARILTCDGTRMDIDPFYRKENYRYEILGAAERKKEPVQELCGCTCMEGDRIFTVRDESELCVGDRIRLYGEGAYTMALTPNFIRFQPAVYACDGTRYDLVRKKWEASEILQNCVSVFPQTGE